MKYYSFLEIDADDEWKEWQKLGDPVLHIDLRGKFIIDQDMDDE